MQELTHARPQLDRALGRHRVLQLATIYRSRVAKLGIAGVRRFAVIGGGRRVLFMAVAANPTTLHSHRESSRPKLFQFVRPTR